MQQDQQTAAAAPFSQLIEHVSNHWKAEQQRKEREKEEAAEQARERAMAYLVMQTKEAFGPIYEQLADDPHKLRFKVSTDAQTQTVLICDPAGREYEIRLKRGIPPMPKDGNPEVQLPDAVWNIAPPFSTNIIDRHYDWQDIPTSSLPATLALCMSFVEQAAAIHARRDAAEQERQEREAEAGRAAAAERERELQEQQEKFEQEMAGYRRATEEVRAIIAARKPWTWPAGKPPVQVYRVHLHGRDESGAPDVIEKWWSWSAPREASPVHVSFFNAVTGREHLLPKTATYHVERFEANGLDKLPGELIEKDKARIEDYGYAPDYAEEADAVYAFDAGRTIEVETGHKVPVKWVRQAFDAMYPQE